jgi:TRAP-type C4-dicarboxylate transport system permease small subunit
VRELTDRLYLYGAFGAGAALIALLICVLYSIAGAAFGFMARGVEDIAGYLLAASCAFAFGSAFAKGDHIKVSLLLGRLTGRPRHLLLVFAHLVASVLGALLVYSSARLVYFSWRFDDRANGMLAIPVWIPQASLLIGSVVLLIAVLDGLMRAGRGEVIQEAPDSLLADR